MSLLRRIDKGDSESKGSTSRRPPVDSVAQATREIKALVGSKLLTDAALADLDPVKNRDAIQRRVATLFAEAIVESGAVLSRSEQARLLDAIISDITGYGLLTPLLNDPDVIEIRVLGPKHIIINHRGMLKQIAETFDDEDQLVQIINRLLGMVGLQVDEKTPLAEARLPDGSRISAVIRPLSLVGPSIIITKTNRRFLTADDLLGMGTFTSDVLNVLRATVQAGLNILISGDHGTGRTTLLNTLAHSIDAVELIVTVEAEPELILEQPHVLPLQSRPPLDDPREAISMTRLIHHARTMRPGHILVGEVGGVEIDELLRIAPIAWLATLTGDTPEDALVALERSCLRGDTQRLADVRTRIAAAVDIVVHMERLHEGQRRITRVSEVTASPSGEILLRDWFAWKHSTPGQSKAETIQRVGKPSDQMLDSLTDHPVSKRLRDVVAAVFK